METGDSGLSDDLLQKIERRKQERDASFADLKARFPLDETREEILGLGFVQLVAKLQSRQWSASEVLHAYVAKAVRVTETLSCVTEFIPQAEEWARQLTEKAQDPQVTLGPLHGLPFAIKDDQDVAGMDTTVGLAKYLYKPAKESAVIVQVLQKLGAVPFCKTNLPQSTMSFGSDNPIYGITRHALNPCLSPGGSSSGSAVLVAAGGAAFATGSDIGGSLRAPAHYHGLASLKASRNRLSEKGLWEALPLDHIRGVPGVIAPDAESLAILWMYLTENGLQNELDPNAVPLPWNELLFASQTKLCFGYFMTYPTAPATPDTQKTVLRARDALMALGHAAKPFQMPEEQTFCKMISSFPTLAQMSTSFNKIFEGEPLAECTRGMVQSVRKEVALKRGNDGAMDTEEIMNILYYRRKLRLDILQRMEECGVDLLLCPAFPHPAIHLEHGHQINGTEMAHGYTGIWNYVDFPAGVVRFGTETLAGLEHFDGENDYFRGIKNALKDSAGMPICVQVVGKPWKEEMVLRALLQIQRLANS